ncbi:4789_t:CDS:1, partial [Acaulospora morrowiae]
RRTKSSQLLRISRRFQNFQNMYGMNLYGSRIATAVMIELNLRTRHFEAIRSIIRSMKTNQDIANISIASTSSISKTDEIKKYREY